MTPSRLVGEQRADSSAKNQPRSSCKKPLLCIRARESEGGTADPSTPPLPVGMESSTFPQRLHPERSASQIYAQHSAYLSLLHGAFRPQKLTRTPTVCN